MPPFLLLWTPFKTHTAGLKPELDDPPDENVSGLQASMQHCPAHFPVINFEAHAGAYLTDAITSSPDVCSYASVEDAFSTISMAGSPCGHFSVHCPHFVHAVALTSCLLYSRLAQALKP